MRDKARTLRAPKRSDLMVEEVKRWIIDGKLKPGDRLPKEVELLKIFSLSKSTVREALKSLEVQGLVAIKSGPEGGATIAEVTFDRTFQFVQNYFFFRDLDVDAIYAMRKVLEPELVAGAVPHLRAADIKQLEASVESCAPTPASAEEALTQRSEDLHFHDLLAQANPNELLRFTCQSLNEMLRRLVVLNGRGLHSIYKELGRSNLAAHRAILEAIRARDAERVRQLMSEHIEEAHELIKRLHAAYQRRLILDSDLREPINIAFAAAGNRPSPAGKDRRIPRASLRKITKRGKK